MYEKQIYQRFYEYITETHNLFIEGEKSSSKQNENIPDNEGLSNSPKTNNLTRLALDEPKCRACKNAKLQK